MVAFFLFSNGFPSTVNSLPRTGAQDGVEGLEEEEEEEEEELLVVEGFVTSDQLAWTSAYALGSVSTMSCISVRIF